MIGDHGVRLECGPKWLHPARGFALGRRYYGQARERDRDRDVVKATLPPLAATWFDRIAHDTSFAYPPIAMEHFARGRGLPTGPIYGRLAFISKALDHDFARKADVYLMPVGDYTAWFVAKLDLSRMFSDGGKEEQLDHGVIDCCVVFDVSDADGYCSFTNVQVGSYYILAIAHRVHPHEHYDMSPRRRARGGRDCRGWSDHHHCYRDFGFAL